MTGLVSGARLRALAVAIAASFITACAGSTVDPVGVVAVSIGGSLRNDGTPVDVTITVTDGKGQPVTVGTVTVVASSGTINGKASDDLALGAGGQAHATYACDVAKVSACRSGSNVSVTASWKGVAGSQLASLAGNAGTDGGTDGGSGGTDGGAADGGSTTDAGTGNGGGSTAPSSAILALLSVSPAGIVTQDAVGTGLPVSTRVSFVVKDALGVGLPGITVNFSTAVGEDLLTLNSVVGSTDLNGIVSVQANSKLVPGLAHVIGSLAFGISTVTANVGIVGPPASVLWTAVAPDVLGLRGSGIQENGLMTFQVTDAYGTPVPNSLVEFSQTQPVLVSLNTANARTDLNGIARVGYTSGDEVGVTTLKATVRDLAHNTSVSGQHQVAVRGARPSASGFYFRCDHGSMRVLDTVTRYDTMKCHVRLSDRSGNRIGIPTPVHFATEAGAITAVGVTKGFNPATPDDPNEGTLEVTFSSDFGNGLGPADVDPLPADPAQYPFARSAEPSRKAGALTVNPRDQLITIIAWTQGEEAFVDANHNGQYDPGELFVDQGDPYIDANDDNQYDQVVPGGQWEQRFCGSTTNGTCPAYQPPNGKWDAVTTIWAPTWVVFVGDATAHSVPTDGTAPASAFSPACADFKDAAVDGVHFPRSEASVFVYDAWLNTPVVGTKYGLGLLDSDIPTVDSVTQHAFDVETESYGSMGTMGLDFDYGAVSANGGPCTTANGTQCVFALRFRKFDSGLRGFLEFSNPTHKPTGATYGCAPGPSAGTFQLPFTVEVTVLNPDADPTKSHITRSYFSGLYASDPP